MNSYLQAFLYGFSEIIFQTNAISGVIVMLGILIASPYYLALGILGNMVAILAAQFIGLDKEIIMGGVSFNGALVGMAMALLIKTPGFAVLFTIFGSILSILIFYYLYKHNITTLAFPYVLSAWTILLLIKFFKII